MWPQQRRHHGMRGKRLRRLLTIHPWLWLVPPHSSLDAIEVGKAAWVGRTTCWCGMVLVIEEVEFIGIHTGSFVNVITIGAVVKWRVVDVRCFRNA